jgi:hypothetical protein
MPRTKQTLRRRAKPHRNETLALRKRKNRLKAKRRKSRARPHRSSARSKK